MPSRGKRLTILIASLAVLVLGVATWQAWPHIQFWWRFESLGLNAQGLPEYRHRATGIVMVRVPGGTFWMGAQKEDPEGPNYDPGALSNEGPVHSVTLSPFLIGKYEVTQRQWKVVMDSNPAHFQSDEKSGSADSPEAVSNQLPVEQVIWVDCQEFCQKTGLRLPTEAQWEYSCRAGARSPYAFGKTISSEEANCNWKYPQVGAQQKTVPVASRRPNAFGLHQLHGNVLEWCEDVYHGGFYSTPGGTAIDPLCTAGSARRVNRGGCYFFDESRCRSAFRNRNGTRAVYSNIGLRAAYYPLPD